MSANGEAEIHLVPYDASWGERFEEERRALSLDRKELHSAQGGPALSERPGRFRPWEPKVSEQHLGTIVTRQTRNVTAGMAT